VAINAMRPIRDTLIAPPGCGVNHVLSARFFL
jgi:hypothetical protein